MRLRRNILEGQVENSTRSEQHHRAKRTARLSQIAESQLRREWTEEHDRAEAGKDLSRAQRVTRP